MANTQNLKPWKSGESGNPAGRPTGSKNLATWIQTLMEDENFTRKLANGKTVRAAPIKAVVTTLIVKAVEGDMRAFDLLAKYGYGSKLDLTSNEQQLTAQSHFNMFSDQFIKHEKQN